MIHGGLVEGRSVVLVLALTACSFSTSLPGEVGVDASSVEEPDGDNTPAPNVVPCKTPDSSGLVVCFEFEDNIVDGRLLDSSAARRDAMTSGMALVPRDGTANSMAADVGPQAATYVAQTSALDLAGAYTLAAWVRPESAMPPSTARGVLDHEGQYAMITSTTAAGTIHNRCQHAGISRYEFTERLPVGQWSFLACTWNGTQLCAYRWASPTDHEHFCHTPPLGPAAAGTKGLAVGHLSYNGSPHSRFDGALDSVHVYERGLTEEQLCALVGQPAGCMPCDLCQ